MAKFNLSTYLNETTEKLLQDDPELRYGREFSEEILDAVRNREEEFRGQVAAELEKANRSQVLRDTAKFAPIVLTTGSAGILTGFLRWGQLPKELRTILSIATILVIALGLFTLGDRYVQARQAALQGVHRATLPLLQAAIREVINEQERSERRWSTNLETTIAPALVELDGLDTISSQTYRRICSFIADHASSAIGIAGPRGAGKSTLMSQLMSDEKLGARIHGLPAQRSSYRAIRVAAPVYYSPAEFTRVIHNELAHSELKWTERDVARRRISAPIRPALERVRRAIGYATLLFIAILIWAWERGYPDYPDMDDVKHDFNLSWPGLLALVFLVLVIGWGLNSAWRLFADRIRLGPANSLHGLCKRQVEFLRWSTSVESTASAALRMGRSGFEGAEKLTRSEREVTHAESVQALRQFIEQFVSLSRMSVVICVDELDKIADARKAVDAVNGIKDLFHIPEAHFLVSVSTDALHSFAARGVPVRDVFDSSFDTIIRMSPLDSDESQKLLSRRTTRFSTVFALFCHAWSGGLARDLIRTATSCIEQAKEHDPNIDVLSDVVIRQDVSEVVRAAVEKLREDTAEAGQKILDEVLVFQELLENQPGMFYEIAEAAVGDGVLPEGHQAVSEAQRLAGALGPYVRFAGLCGKLFARPYSYDGWRSTELRAAVESLAQARASFGSHPRQVAKRIDAAQVKVDAALML